MFIIQSRGGRFVAWRQSEATAPPTGTYAPRGKWSAGGRGFRSRAYAHVSEGAASGTDSLTATGITTGQPTLGGPVLDGTPGAVDLIADGIVSGIHVLGSPALGQIHVITATGVTAGAPAIGAPTLAIDTGDTLYPLAGLAETYPLSGLI